MVPAGPIAEPDPVVLLIPIAAALFVLAAVVIAIWYLVKNIKAVIKHELKFRSALVRIILPVAFLVFATLTILRIISLVLDMIKA